MNYKKVYDQLILHRQNNKISPNQVYCENHHIIPKSCNGSNDSSNLVYLTAREHFIAHMLLMHIMEGTIYESAMAYAYKRLCTSHHNHLAKIKVNSKLFTILRERANKNLKNRIRINNGVRQKNIYPAQLDEYLDKGYRIGGLPMSSETKQKMSRAHIGKKINFSPEGLKRLQESCQKNGQKQKGRPKSIESRKKLSETRKLKYGRKTPYIRKHVDPENDGRKNNGKNRTHYTNGIINIFVITGTQPDGFYIGQTNHTYLPQEDWYILNYPTKEAALFCNMSEDRVRARRRWLIKKAKNN